MNLIRRALDQSGINASSLDRIRLARGVIGKTSYVAAAAVLALGGVAWRLDDPIYLLVEAILIVLVFTAYFAGTLWFANRHPGVALLEGAELIQWRQMDIAAKTVSSIENKSISEPDTPRSER
jgi:hypothetical protein